jgi:hypothetical protein
MRSEGIAMPHAADGLQREMDRLTAEIDKIVAAQTGNDDRLFRLRTLRAAAETELRRRG